MKPILVAALGTLGLAGLADFYPPAQLAIQFAAGRSPDCPFPRAIQTKAHNRQLEETHDRIMYATKLIREDGGAYQQWRTPNGDYWVPHGSRFVLPFNLAEQDLKIYGEGPRFVRPGDVVMDCGANIGVFTRVALAAGAKQVIAIEPAPENLECLRRNLAAEIAAQRVVVIPKGVWDKQDVLTLRVDPKNSAADTFVLHPDGAKDSIQVPLTTIDQLAQELHLDRLDFIKMDIEGAEPRALAGGIETIRKFRPRIAISAYHEQDHAKRIPQVVRQARTDYQMECGPCELGKDGIIRPDILRFY